MEESLAIEICNDEPSEATANKAPRPKCRDDGYQTLSFSNSLSDASNIQQVSSLCSVDKMRIDHLISELHKCRDANREIKLRLAASKSENDAIERKFESHYSCHENEKINMESKLATETRELNELTTSTSYSLDILADLISAWEVETSFIKDTVNKILDQKIHLQKNIENKKTEIMILRAEESRIENTIEMNKLNSKKDHLKSDIGVILTSEKGCQSEEISMASLNQPGYCSDSHSDVWKHLNRNWSKITPATSALKVCLEDRCNYSNES